MRATLGFEIAVRVWTFDRKGRAPETGLVAGRGFEELRLEAATLGPAQIHSHEHLGPIGGVSAADPGGDREDGAPLVVRPRELCLEARARDFLGELRSVVGDVGFHLWISVGHRRELAQIFGARAEVLPPRQTIALTSESLQDLLCALPVLPEVRLDGLGL